MATDWNALTAEEDRAYFMQNWSRFPHRASP